MIMSYSHNKSRIDVNISRIVSVLVVSVFISLCTLAYNNTINHVRNRSQQIGTSTFSNYVTIRSSADSSSTTSSSSSSSSDSIIRSLLLLQEKAQRLLGMEVNIVGGTIVNSTNKYPSFAYGDGCGATVIHPDILLSAGHCYAKGYDNSITYQIGGIEKSKSGSTERIRSLFHVQHPKYNRATITNDILIIKLRRPSTAPIQVLNYDATIPSDNDNVTTIGFGSFDPNGTQYDGKLRRVTMSVIGTDTCNSIYGGFVHGDTMICAGNLPDGGKDACEGDSGGPLYIVGNGTKNRLVQVGITSFGNTFCGNSPGVYTRVSAYEKWIKDQICGYTSVRPRPQYCSGRPILEQPKGHCPCSWWQMSCRIQKCR
jgi:secreted trypsin-like serine protease